MGFVAKCLTRPEIRHRVEESHEGAAHLPIGTVLAPVVGGPHELEIILM
jgi:hypothetical protein